MAATAASRARTARQSAPVRGRAFQALNHGGLAGPLCPEAALKALSAAWFGGTPEAQMANARKASEVGFVSNILKLKGELFDHGRRLEAASGSARDQKRLDAWLQDKRGAALVDGVARKAWKDWLQLDVFVLAWYEFSSAPGVLAPESCTYRNCAGSERLDWKHGYEKEDLDLIAEQFTDAKERTAFKLRYGATSGLVRVGDPQWNEKWPALAEEFFVARRDESGRGFGEPRLKALFTVLDTVRSLEIGESVLAHGGRHVLKQHKLGYEPTGSSTVSQTHAKKGDITAVRTAVEGKSGLQEMVENFDHKVEFATIDPKFFTEEKWRGVRQAIADWGGPLAQMFLAGTTDGREAPMMAELLLAEAHAERSRMAGALAPVLGQFAPVPVRFAWSDACFVDFRLRFETLLKGVQAGAVSLPTLHEALGLDTARERERMKAMHEEKGVWRPVFDAAHGDDPGGAGGAGGGGGRPVGAPDP